MASIGAELTGNLLALLSSGLPLRLGVALPLASTNGGGPAPVSYLRLGSSFQRSPRIKDEPSRVFRVIDRHIQRVEKEA